MLPAHTGFFAVSLLLAGICAAAAEPQFHPYETRGPMIKEGQGGERKIIDGIDIWAHGDPPRRYQILGSITDERSTAPVLFGHGMTDLPRDIASAVKTAGGDAAILDSQADAITGVYSRSYDNGQVQTFADETRKSRYLVVKYLPEAPAGPAQQ
jgi:hypothetical protein